MLEDLELPTRNIPCKVRTLMETLNTKDQEILKNALQNPEWTTSALSKELTKRGFKISDKPIMTHRAGRCSCEPR